MSDAPSPDLAIIETRVYRGANVWSYDKAIHLVVDLGVLEDWPTDRIPGFTERLLELLRRGLPRRHDRDGDARFCKGDIADSATHFPDRSARVAFP